MEFGGAPRYLCRKVGSRHSDCDRGPRFGLTPTARISSWSFKALWEAGRWEYSDPENTSGHEAASVTFSLWLLRYIPF